MEKIRTGFIIIVIIFMVAFILFSLLMGYLNSKTYEIEVKDKFIKTADNEGKYLVVDTNNNTYKIEDLFFIGKFNSTDIYNSIEVGKKYKIKTTGFRIHIFSMYQNINKVELLEE